jgi:hypothetical protein
MNSNSGKVKVCKRKLWKKWGIKQTEEMRKNGKRNEGKRRRERKAVIRKSRDG